VKSGCKVFSIGDPGDQHYKLKVIGNNISILDDLVFGNISESKLLKEAKNPVIIIGESVLKSEISKNVISSVQTLLKDINKLDSFNILHQSASNVGSLILGLQTENLQKVYDADVLYLLNADEVNIDKKNNQFIIYQGSHGDKGAEIADIILPGAAYTEQNGHFTNLEGKIQKAFKASYPPGEAKEDWQIINELAEFMNNRKLFNDKDELESSMFNYINLQKENRVLSDQGTASKNFAESENLAVAYKEYYFSNVIARSSKTMLDCYNSKLESKKTGTDG
ncbi:MAG: NADH-quinone oxidoreductase subunit G, partial [Proteobacteria bacterium]|nr:NADH-quinone oxidoreductase subunit G [Pseudomonadota bacterium]